MPQLQPAQDPELIVVTANASHTVHPLIQLLPLLSEEYLETLHSRNGFKLAEFVSLLQNVKIKRGVFL